MRTVAGFLLKKIPKFKWKYNREKSHGVTYLRGDEESKLSLLQAQLLSVFPLGMHRSYFTPTAASTLRDALMHPGRAFSAVYILPIVWLHCPLWKYLPEKMYTYNSWSAVFLKDVESDVVNCPLKPVNFDF